jgi:putative transposase
MRLTSQTVIKESSEWYKKLDEFCFRAKNLYNVGLYRLREAYFWYDTTMSYESLDKVLKREKSVDYANMPMAACAQGTLRAVMESWASFWSSVKSYGREPSRFMGKPKMPKYLHKTKGRSVVYLTNQNVKHREGILHFPKTFEGLTIPFALVDAEIQQVRIVPKNRHIVVEVVYKAQEAQMKPDNSRYMGVDLGIDNFAAVASNDGSQPVLINGKGLKSLNKRWNKRMAHLREVETAMNGEWIATSTGRAKVSGQTKQQAKLTNKRNNQAKDFCHKASKKIVDLAMERGCNTIVVGKNDGWKQESKMGTVVNQSFVQIPHAVFIDMLEYKCEKHGLNFFAANESHTSKTSWLDDETPQHHESYAGRRVERGLFRAASGSLVNADVNGAMQIVRKVFPEAKADGVWAYGQPVRVGVI